MSEQRLSDTTNKWQSEDLNARRWAPEAISYLLLWTMAWWPLKPSVMPLPPHQPSPSLHSSDTGLLPPPCTPLDLTHHRAFASLPSAEHTLPSKVTLPHFPDLGLGTPFMISPSSSNSPREVSGDTENVFCTARTLVLLLIGLGDLLIMSLPSASPPLPPTPKLYEDKVLLFHCPSRAWHGLWLTIFAE